MNRRTSVMHAIVPKLAMALPLLLAASMPCVAEISLVSASAQSVTAQILPDSNDVGSTVGVWMGALYRGSLYMRNGTQWTAYASGALPQARSMQLAATNTILVVDQVDLTPFPGLELYLGYGSSEQDMLTAPGKLAKIYTVPQTVAAAPSNVAPLIVDAGPAGLPVGDLNMPFISVTVCGPSGECQTIDHIHVDTGSTGLRIISSVLSPALALPLQRSASGSSLAECIQFADGTSVWGSVRTAEVRIAGERTASVPVHLIGDPGYPSIPRACTGTPVNSVSSFGANGIIGVGHFREDCGGYCADNSANNQYFSCTASGCISTTVPRAQQVTNPVALFARHNNGVVIQLPAISESGETAASGSLILGIGTQDNNALGSARILPVEPTYGMLTTIYRNISYVNSVIDSGSTVNFLPSGAGITACSRRDPIAPGFLCPSTTQRLSATLRGPSGATNAINFTVANARTLLTNDQLSAFNNVAATNGDPYGFSWGLPFFYGRSVYTAIEGTSTPGGLGPYVAF